MSLNWNRNWNWNSVCAMKWRFHKCTLFPTGYDFQNKQQNFWCIHKLYLEQYLLSRVVLSYTFFLLQQTRDITLQNTPLGQYVLCISQVVDKSFILSSQPQYVTKRLKMSASCIESYIPPWAIRPLIYWNRCFLAQVVRNVLHSTAYAF